MRILWMGKFAKINLFEKKFKKIKSSISQNAKSVENQTCKTKFTQKIISLKVGVNLG